MTSGFTRSRAPAPRPSGAALLRLMLPLAVLILPFTGFPLDAQSGAKGSKPADPFRSVEFAAAMQAGTRTDRGVPGPRYWQQEAQYTLSAQINPLSKRLAGRGTIRYVNRAPTALGTLYLHLHANLFEPGARTNSDATSLGGVRLTKLAVNGVAVDSVKDRKKPGYSITGTVLELRLVQPLASGASLTLETEWNLRIQPETAPRGGQDNEVWILTYWYPQLAVYDDVNGWQNDPYLGRGEFYMGYADYDVQVTVPAGWLVTSTGTLLNADSVLAPGVRERLALAAASDSTVHVVTAEQRGIGGATQGVKGGTLTWHFAAKGVRDVAFGASPFWVWDAMAAPVGDADGDGTPDRTLAQAFYRPAATRWFWGAAAPMTRHALGVFSRDLWPYPYPHMTAVEGPPGCGGMEYPMLTCIGERPDSLRFYTVLAHEIAHMWFPMQVGTDEKRNAWMDEGTAQWLQGVAVADWTKGKGDFDENRGIYLQFARRGGEEPILRESDRYGNAFSYAVASYYKPVAVYQALGAVIGDSIFREGVRDFGRAWRGKHPQAEDWFHAIEARSGKDLRWFWEPWFAGTGTLDLAIDTVNVEGDSAEVYVERRGSIAMPIVVQVGRADGSSELLTIAETVWADGRKKYVFVIPEGRSPVRRVRLDPEQRYPYLDRSRLEWRK